MNATKTWLILARLALVLLLGLASRQIARADGCTDYCDTAYLSCIASSGEDPNCLSCPCNCAMCLCYVGCGDGDLQWCKNNGCNMIDQ